MWRKAHGPRSFLRAKLFTGTSAEQKQVLKSFVLNKQNLEAVEAEVLAEASHEQELEGTTELLTIDGMRKAGCSQPLDQILG